MEVFNLKRGLAGRMQGWASRMSSVVTGAAAAVMVAALVAPAPAAVAQSNGADGAPAPAGEVAPAAANAPAWLEPRGVNVVDLVGVVPEDVLRDSMVVYEGGNALAFYQSGSRSGNTVTVRVGFVSKANNGAACLGMPGIFDSWPSISPAGVLHIYQGDVDVTRSVQPSFQLWPAGQIQPATNTANIDRYTSTTVQAQFDGSGGLILPANMGCKLFLSDTSGPLTGEFTFDVVQTISAAVLGSASLQFHSYIGPGDVGQLAPLMQQMRARYGNRAEDLRVKPPAGTEFVWVRYPATPVAPWDPQSPAGGTYRVRRSNGKLSVDHLASMGLPLYGQWQDADQSPGTTFLPYFTDSVAVSAPEYVVPAGISYDPCMTQGNCPDALLQQIHDATMPMTVTYLAISRSASDLQQISLAAVGPSWSPGDQPFAARREAYAAARTGAYATAHALARAAAQPKRAVDDFNLYLPALSKFTPPSADDPTANCPCGWFSSDGRMMDFVQKP